MKQIITKVRTPLRGLLLCFVLGYSYILPAMAQQMQISGTIKDGTTEELIPGVSVLRKGTSTGTVSDIDGKYTIAAEQGDTLMFSYLGMQPISRVANASVIDVIMQAEDIGLDEVVVIGYGTTTKAKMVGAVSSLGKEKLEETPFYNVGSSLQGQVPGLVVQNNGGGPGSSPNISIRGAGSPLYVIDGVITTEQDFNTLNSNDIETISFLKDAAATAVYGSKAGNGIVLVTTRRGQEGKINVNYSYNYQMSQPTVLPGMLNSYEYALIQNQANAYDGTPATYTSEQLEIIRNHGDLDTYPDNNWPDLTLKNFAPEQRHNLSLNGGSKRTNYFVSLGYADQGGILKEDVVNYNRLNIRSNVVSKFEEIGLEVGMNINASFENYQEPSAGMYSIWRAVNQNTNPMYRAYNEDGTLAGGGNGDHPLALTSPDAGYNKNRDKFINTQLSLNWAVPQVEGLKFGAMANYRNGDGWGKLWEKNVPLYMQDGSVMNQPPPQLTVASYYNQRVYFETSANYQRTFGLHGVDATFVYNLNTNRMEDMSAFRRGYLSGAVDQLFAGPADGKDNNGTEAEGANAGYVMRVKYDFNYKYILEFSGRYDGNDNFAPEQRWGFFPALSAAWNVTDEPFMKNLSNRNIVNDLKLRVSYGETGITQGVNRFGYIPVYNLEPNAYNIGGNLVNGYSEGDLVNPLELTWYTRRSLNYGMDFSSLGGKLTGTFEYFYYRTTGFLVSPKDIYALPLGKDLPQIKSNSAQRRAGFELSMNYRGQLGALKYEIGGNYSYFNQLWEQLDTENEATLMNPYIRETHRTDYWGGGAVLVTEGLYQTEEEILNNPRLLSSTATQQGDIKYTDANGDGKIDEQDKRTVGLPSLPHGTYGLNFSLKYKGWSMNGLFQGTGDRYLAFDNFMIVEAKRRTYQFQQDYWTEDNPNSLFPRVSHIEQINGGNNSNATYPSDYYLKNAKYFRLRNLQVGYDLKHSLLDGVDWVSNCRIFVNGTNLFTISPVMDYFDPEQAETGSGVQTYGYPVQRTFAVGLNVGF